MRRYYTALIASLAVLLALWLYGVATFREATSANRTTVATVGTLATVNSMIVALSEFEAEFEAIAVMGNETSRDGWDEARAAFLRLADSLEVQIGSDPVPLQQLRASSAAFDEWVEMQRSSGILDASEEERQVLVQEALRDGGWFLRSRALAGRVVSPLIAIQARAAESVQASGVRISVLNTRADRAMGALSLATLLFGATAAILLVRRGRDIQRNNRELREQITARARATREVRRLSLRQGLILDSAADGIIGAHEDGTAVFINPSAIRMLGGGTLATGQHVGRIFDVGETGVDPITHVLENGTARENARGTVLRADGSTFPVEYSAVPAREENGGITGVVVTFRDIAQRQEVERLKNEFISIVSHELRTPLTSLRGSLGLLATGRLGDLDAAGSRMLEIAVESTDRLIRLVSDILDIERMEAGRVTLEITPVDLRVLARSALDQTRPMAEGQRVELTLAADPTETLADADRIIQVMTNLLSNAIKFSEPGERVELRISRDEEQRPLVQVSDSGRGIPSDKLESVFDRFQQVDSTDARTHGGTGLGLAICRSIVEQHGGRIWVESEMGTGSTFSFVLPGPDALPAPEEGSDAPATDQPLVLIWTQDAEPDTVRALHHAGYRTAQVSRRDQLVAEAARLRPEALLLDLGEPPMEDLELLEALRSNAVTCEIPVVLLSQLAPGKELLEPESGVEWIEAPFEPEELVNAVISARISRSGAEHILIVEDDVDLAEMLAESFAQQGIRTEHAATGRDALVMALQSPPAMVILDLMLPEGNGEWVVAWMRRHESLRNTTLMVYSARDLGPDERARLRLGQTAYLTKSEVGPAEFEERVLEMFRRVAPMDEAAGDGGAS